MIASSKQLISTPPFLPPSYDLLSSAPPAGVLGRGYHYLWGS